MSLDVVMPFHGDVVHLRAAVISVTRQTDPHWRLVVVDDAYPDPTVAAWFRDLAHPQVHYLRNPVNLGLNANFREALSHAEADWVVVMGCDDLMLPGYVRRVHELVAAHPTCGVVQPGVQVVDGAGAVVRPLPDRVKQALRPRTSAAAGRGTELGGEALVRSLLRGNWTYFPSLCWRREVAVAHGFSPGLDVVLDLALLLDVVLAGGTLVLDDEPVFGYRRHAGSASMLGAAAGSRFEEERAFFAATADRLTTRGWPSAARAARWQPASRLNAAASLPAALRRRRWETAHRLVRHVVGSSRGAGTGARTRWEHRA